MEKHPYASAKPHPLLHVYQESRSIFLLRHNGDKFALVDNKASIREDTQELAVNFSRDLFYIQGYTHTRVHDRFGPSSFRFSGLDRMEKIMIRNDEIIPDLADSSTPELWIYFGQNEPDFT